jgi:ATP-dependent Clp protease adaptor protein ClpS
MPDTLDVPRIDEDEFLGTLRDDLYAVIVWNDDVNTFAHVITALVEIFGHSRARAEFLAWRVHNTGKAVVAVRPKDEAVAGMQALHRRRIQASVEPA